MDAEWSASRVACTSKLYYDQESKLTIPSSFFLFLSFFLIILYPLPFLSVFPRLYLSTLPTFSCMHGQKIINYVLKLA